MDKKNKKNLLWLLILVLATIGILAHHNRPMPFHANQGMVFGTMYNIIYQHKEDLRSEIEAELQRFDGSLSPFNDTSIISRVNRNCVSTQYASFTSYRWCIRHHHCTTCQCLGIWIQTRKVPYTNTSRQPLENNQLQDDTPRY